ncbi:hypothetical protein J4Q44_G00368470 [Coregonus suidteri]|uniref:Uncharacterized protein n=1 Tax=Coregonus suidteri TaxID=861788 RepID=A0AAN8QDI0_9TELE
MRIPRHRSRAVVEFYHLGRRSGWSPYPGNLVLCEAPGGKGSRTGWQRRRRRHGTDALYRNQAVCARAVPYS